MSWKISYKCEYCGYTTEVYEGKGFMGQKIIPMSCPDCHTIQPLVTGGVIGQAAPSFNSLVDRLCLNCGSQRITPWDGHTCPRCGREMKPTGGKKYWT